MKLFKYLIFQSLLLVPLVSQAQYRSGRLEDIARNLADRADRAADMAGDQRGYREEQSEDLRQALRNFAQNVRNWAGRVDDARRDTYRGGAQQLVTEAENIGRLVDRTDVNNRVRRQWTGVEDEVQRLSDYYGLSFSASNAGRDYRRRGGSRDRDWDRDRDRDLARRDPYDYGDLQHGSLRWRGRVDGSDIIYVRRDRVDIRHLQANPITDATFDISSPLPRLATTVQLRRLSGRGRVQVVQQPSPQNGYAAGVQIDDPEGGADYYEFELTW